MQSDLLLKRALSLTFKTIGMLSLALPVTLSQADTIDPCCTRAIVRGKRSCEEIEDLASPAWILRVGCVFRPLNRAITA